MKLGYVLIDDKTSKYVSLINNSEILCVDEYFNALCCDSLEEAKALHHYIVLRSKLIQPKIMEISESGVRDEFI